MSTLKVNTIQNTSAAHSSTPEQLSQGRAKAWINFNADTPAIRDSFNVSSLTDNGTGDFTTNFTSSMANTTYIVTGFACDEASRVCALGNESMSRDISPNRDTFAVGSARLPTCYISGTNGESNNVDCSQTYLIFFGD